MTQTKNQSLAFPREATTRPDRPVNLEELVIPLAEVMAADNNPRARLGEIVAMLMSHSRMIGAEATNYLRDAAR